MSEMVEPRKGWAVASGALAILGSATSGAMISLGAEHGYPVSIGLGLATLAYFLTYACLVVLAALKR